MSCTSQTLAGLIRDCSASLGGISEVYIANHGEIVGKPTITTEKVSAITMASGKYFTKYEFRANTANAVTTWNINNETGTKYTSTDLVLKFNRLETTKRAEIMALALADLAVIFKDANGKYWYMGYDEAVSMTAGTAQTGTAKADENGYNVTLHDEQLQLPYEVDPTVIATILNS